MTPDRQADAPVERDTASEGGASRVEVVGLVLAGELGEQEAAERLGVPRSTLVHWKAQALEALEGYGHDGTPEPAEAATGPVGAFGPAVPDSPEGLLIPRPDHRPEPVEPRLVAAGAIGLATLATAVALARPTGLSGLEVFDALNRWAMYAATLFAVGGVLFLWRIHDGHGSAAERHALAWWTQLAALVGVVTSMLALSVHAAAVAGIGPATMIDHHEVGRAADGAFGAATVLRLLGLVYIVYALRRIVHALRRAVVASSRLVAITGAVLAVGSFLLVGHTATGEPRVLVLTADLVHTVSAAGWFGGLVLLAMAVRHRRATGHTGGAATMVGRFSAFAAASVAALLVSGLAMAATEVSGPSDLFGHEYGVTLLIKVGVVLPVLGAAFHNLRRLVPELRRHHADSPEAWGMLRRTMALEVAGLVVVLLVTALLVNLPTPG